MSLLCLMILQNGNSVFLYFDVTSPGFAPRLVLIRNQPVIVVKCGMRFRLNLLRISRNSSRVKSAVGESSDLWRHIRLRTIKVSQFDCVPRKWFDRSFLSDVNWNRSVRRYFAGHCYLRTATSCIIVCIRLNIVSLHKCLQLRILSYETFKNFMSSQQLHIWNTVVVWGSKDVCLLRSCAV
jgi:hypothetical protein